MRRLLLLLLLPLAVEAVVLPQVEMKGRAGDFRRGAGAQVWAPVYDGGNQVTFVQAEGGRFEDLWVGSAGIGFREAFNSCWGWGANLFLDAARSNSDRDYLQLGAGFEAFGPCWIARGNVYLVRPNTFREEKLRSILTVPGELVDTFEGSREQAFYGGDMEAGGGVIFGPGEAWLFAGAYAYKTPRIRRIIGPRVRAEYRLMDMSVWLGPRLTIGGEYSWDDYHRSKGSVVASLRWPLGNPKCRKERCCQSICQRLGESVWRQPAIWVRRSTSIRREVIPAPRIFFVAEGAPDVAPGTQMDPVSIVGASALANLPGDAIILLSTGGATIDLPLANAPYDLLLNQTLAGFAGMKKITVDVGGRPVTVINDSPGLPTATLALNPMTGADLIRASQMNEIFNINTSGGDRAIIGLPGQDLLVHNVTVDAAAPGAMEGAIDIVAGPGVRIENVQVTNLTGDATAAAIQYGGANLMLSSSMLSSSGGRTGLRLNSAMAVTAMDVTMSGFATGVDVNGGSGVVLRRISIPNASDLALDIMGLGGQNTFDTIDTTTAVTSAALFTDNTGVIDITDSTLAAAGPAVLDFAGASSSAKITVTNSMVSGGDLAVRAIGGANEVTFVGGSIVNGDMGALVMDTTGGSYNLVNFTMTTGSRFLTIDGAMGGVSLANSNFTTMMAGVTGIMIADATGPISATMSGLNLPMAGQPIDISGGSAAIDFRGLGVTSTNDTGTSIEVMGMTGGSVDFGPITLSMNAATAPSVLLGTSPSTPFTFQSLNVMSADVALEGAMLGGLTTSANTVLASTGEAALRLTDVPMGSVQVATLTSTSSASEGIDLDNVGASLAIASGSVAMPTMAGVSIQNSSGSFDLGALEITNGMTTGIELTSNTGSLNFEGTINGMQEQGVIATMTSGDITLDGATVEEYALSNNMLAGIFVDNPQGGTIAIQGKSTVTKTGSNLNTIQIERTSGSTLATVKVLDSTLANGFDGVGAMVTASPLELVVQDTQISGVSRGVAVSTSGAGSSMTSRILQNTISGQIGVVLTSAADSTNTTHRFDVEQNTITGAVNGGVDITFNGAAGGGNNFQGTVSNNTFNRCCNPSFSHLGAIAAFADAGDVATLLFENNTVTNTQGGFTFFGLINNMGTLNITLKDTHQGPTPVPTDRTYSLGTSANLCVNIAGNSGPEVGGFGLDLSQGGAGIIDVVAPPGSTFNQIIAHIEAANSFGKVAFSGAPSQVQPVDSCPTPDFP